MNSQDLLDDELLEQRVDTFYGYGTYRGDYWFIGMEEAGGGDFKDIHNRMNTWSNRGSQEIDDIAEYHTDIRGKGSFLPDAKLDAKLDVPVWKSIIRVLLSAKGKENITLEDIREYQRYKLGRKDKETCLLELLSLPSPSHEHWIYNQHSRLTFLANRKEYENHCVEKRRSHINDKIKEYQPKAVVFYGIGYEYSWRRIAADIEFSETSEGFLSGRNSQTIFVIAKHPSAFGVTKEYFHNIGKSICRLA